MIHFSESWGFCQIGFHPGPMWFPTAFALAGLVTPKPGKPLAALPWAMWSGPTAPTERGGADVSLPSLPRRVAFVGVPLFEALSAAHGFVALKA